jgi:hypothetical protein
MYFYVFTNLVVPIWNNKSDVNPVEEAQHVVLSRGAAASLSPTAARVAFAGVAWHEFPHRLPLIPVLGALVVMHFVGQAVGLYDVLALIVPGAAILTGIVAGLILMNRQDMGRE